MFMKIYIIPILLISPMFSLSCNSWFSIWMTMELNLMTFIPFMIFFNKFNKEISIKYFLIQTISSSILLMASNLLLTNTSYNLHIFKLSIIFINLSILIKTGSSPFHSWFINIMNNMNWINCLILSTWQKIIPLMTLMYLYNLNLLYISIILSSMTGSIMGLNHQSIRILLGYSSINHLSWMLMNLMFSEFMWILYFITYSIINFSIMIIFNYYKIFYLNQLFFFNLQKFNKITIFMNFISMSGLPPTLGFIMKWMSIFYSSWNSQSFMILNMMLLSILSFIYYTRLCISLLMNSNMSNKMTFNNKFITKNKFSLLNFLLISQSMNLWMLSMWMI